MGRESLGWKQEVSLHRTGGRWRLGTWVGSRKGGPCWAHPIHTFGEALFPQRHVYQRVLRMQLRFVWGVPGGLILITTHFFLVCLVRPRATAQVTILQLLRAWKGRQKTRVKKRGPCFLEQFSGTPRRPG